MAQASDFLGFQSSNAVEGLVKLLRRMTSNVYPTSTQRQPNVYLQRLPDVILRMSFIRPSTAY